MRRLLLPVLAGLLGLACSKPQSTPVVIREAIPVPCPPPIIPARPHLPTAQLGPEPTLEALLKALLADRELLAAWGLDLETRLKAYQPPSPAKETAK